MSSKPKPNSMKVNGEHERLPKLRFRQFRQEPAWDVKVIGEYLAESRLPGSDGAAARKLTVKLWGKGVQEKNESVKGSENTQYYLRRAGQFIYSKLDFVHQAFGIIPPDLDGLESTVDLPCFDVSRGLNTHFLLEYVQRPSFYRRHGELADGGRKAKRIQAEAFLSFPILVPSNREEQEQIAECLISLDELIAARGRKLEALRSHKRGLMQHLFPQPGETVPRLRFSEFRDGLEWKVVALGDLAEVLNNRRVPLASDRRRPGPYPYYGASGIVDHIDEYIFDERLLLVGEDGAKWGPFERTAFVAQGRYWVNNHAHVLKCVAILDTLLEAYLTMADLDGYVAGCAPPKLTLLKLRSIPVPVPPYKEEQELITECISSLDETIAAEVATLDVLKVHKSGLMQGLFPAPEGA